MFNDMEQEIFLAIWLQCFKNLSRSTLREVNGNENINSKRPVVPIKFTAGDVDGVGP